MVDLLLQKTNLKTKLPHKNLRNFAHLSLSLSRREHLLYGSPSLDTVRTSVLVIVCTARQYSIRGSYHDTSGAAFVYLAQHIQSNASVNLLRHRHLFYHAMSLRACLH